MAIYVSSLELVEPLLGSQASLDDVAGAVVAATYGELNATWAAGGGGGAGGAALSNATVVARLYAQGYIKSLPAARRRSLRRLHAAPVQRSPEELQPLFASVAKVRRRG
jgi:hypothetical protein